MAQRHPHRAVLLGELRRGEWRRLLLACALLAVWARLLVPMAASAAPVAANDQLAGVICTLAAAGAASSDAPATLAHDDRLCPFCRAGDPALDVPPGSPAFGGRTHAILGLTTPRPPAPPLHAFVAHPQPRGPPGIATTL